ncbi:MAG: hypothetical protein NZL83_00795 [Candidatus Absconditabacterales bacterium]|nr:hypothetical protein [Candidatus Absconditabacterales bacterium]
MFTVSTSTLGNRSCANAIRSIIVFLIEDQYYHVRRPLVSVDEDDGIAIWGLFDHQ